MSAVSQPAATGSSIAKNARMRFTLPPMLAFVGTAAAFAALYAAAGASGPLFVQYQQQWGFAAGLLTIAFAAYAFTLVLALVFAGSLSDFIGRRPVLVGALVVELGSMLMFLFAPDIGWVIAARAVQGLATGAASSAFSASLLELAPERAKRVASIIGGAAPAGGIGIGALLAGFAVQFSAAASAVVFITLSAIMLLGAGIAGFSKETVSRRVGALRSLAPRVTVPVAGRRDFASVIPILIAGWMFSALFIGIAPTIVNDLFHIHSGVVEGLTVFVAPALAAVSGFVLGRVVPRTVLIVGGATVAIGVLIVIAGIAFELLPLVWIGGAIGGFGFGAAFSGSLRLVGPFADVHQRAELFAAIFLVSYLAFGVPAIILGQLVGPLGLLDAVIGYSAVTLVAAAVGIVVQARRHRAARRSA